MSLQKVVASAFAPALPGQAASVTGDHYSAVTLLAEGEVTIGNFVFNTATPGKENTHVKGSTSTDAVRGVAMRGAYSALGFEATTAVAEGTALEVLTAGQVWVKASNSSTPPKVGDFVYAMIADGKVQTSKTFVPSSAATSFVVEYVADPTANDSMIIINNETASGVHAPTE